MNFCGKKVLVYGMGTSGQAACKLLHRAGACVSFYDDENRFGTFFNFDKEPLQHKYDFLVVSPGVKVSGNKIISHFLITKTPVLSELDLGYIFAKGRFVGITGTNGKTTTTLLVGKIFKESGRASVVCGNIGLPVCSAVMDNENVTFVTEVSNFQLELSQKFFAKTACILNITEDHLDRHGSMEEYVRVKKKILSQKGRQKVVLNYDDQYSKIAKISKNNIYFSKKELNKGIFIKNNAIFHNKTKIISLNDIPLLGEKNLENILAAVAICAAEHIKPKFIRSGIMTFSPPLHRLQYLGKYNGALVYDDSKATNISSVESAISAFSGGKIVLLMGGRNKDLNFDSFFAKNYKIFKLITFGECGKDIEKVAQKYNYDCVNFDKMEEACQYVKTFADETMIILLSPACASFDEFASYAVRGERFKEIIFS